MHSLAGNKEPFDRVDEAAIYSALQVCHTFFIFGVQRWALAAMLCCMNFSTIRRVV
jgi:hypothetical protein